MPKTPGPFLRWIALALLLAATGGPAGAAELSLLGGALDERETSDRSYSWQIEYLHGLGEHFAASVSYVNEGHLPEHHRDDHAAQLWARINALDRRFSLAAGAGPLHYFDTAKRSGGGRYTNDHGWGGLFSVAATWHTQRRWLLQVRTNWAVSDRHFDTVSLLAGVGYQLDPPPAAGPIDQEPRRQETSTRNEVTLFLGQTIVNSFNSNESIATGIEYRRALWRYMDWTVGGLHEGDSHLIGRGGLTTQLWLVRALLDDRVTIGVGAGAYFVVERHGESLHADGVGGFLSGINTITASYRFHPRWQIRISWNRILTNYNRDTDVILAGVGYRF